MAEIIIWDRKGGRITFAPLPLSVLFGIIFSIAIEEAAHDAVIPILSYCRGGTDRQPFFRRHISVLGGHEAIRS